MSPAESVIELFREKDSGDDVTINEALAAYCEGLEDE